MLLLTNLDVMTNLNFPCTAVIILCLEFEDFKKKITESKLSSRF